MIGKVNKNFKKPISKKKESRFFSRYVNRYGTNGRLPYNFFDTIHEDGTIIDIQRNIKTLLIEIAKGNVNWGDIYLFKRSLIIHNENIKENVRDDTTVNNGIYNNGYLPYFSSMTLRYWLFQEATMIMQIRKIALENAEFRDKYAKPNDPLFSKYLTNRFQAFKASEYIFDAMSNLCYQSDIEQLVKLPARLKSSFPMKAIVDESDEIW